MSFLNRWFKRGGEEKEKINVLKHMEKKKKKGRDKITGVEGVVTSIAFDLFGCIQIVLTLPATKEGKSGDSYLMDIARIEIVDHQRAMELPPFKDDSTLISQGKKGGIDKPDATTPTPI